MIVSGTSLIRKSKKEKLRQKECVRGGAVPFPSRKCLILCLAQIGHFAALPRSTSSHFKTKSNSQPAQHAPKYGAIALGQHTLSSSSTFPVPALYDIATPPQSLFNGVQLFPIFLDPLLPKAGLHLLHKHQIDYFTFYPPISHLPPLPSSSTALPPFLSRQVTTFLPPSLPPYLPLLLPGALRSSSCIQGPQKTFSRRRGSSSPPGGADKTCMFCPLVVG